MSGTGQLDIGLVEVVSRENGEKIGYAYTVETPTGQLQRWLLYRDPHNAFDIKPPPPSMAGWTLADWQAKVPTLWTSGSGYVWAQTDLYAYGGTYRGEIWTRIPPVSRLPPPSYFGSTDDLQLDPGGARVLHLLQDQLRGFAYTVGGFKDTTNVEYWLLPASYKPAGKLATAGITPGTETARSLDEFIEKANQHWEAGCRFAITACSNYRGDRAPSAP